MFNKQFMPIVIYPVQHNLPIYLHLDNAVTGSNLKTPTIHSSCLKEGALCTLMQLDKGQAIL